jgi:hypothetical protein
MFSGEVQVKIYNECINTVTSPLNMFVSITADRGFQPWLCQVKVYSNGIITVTSSLNMLVSRTEDRGFEPW